MIPRLIPFFFLGLLSSLSAEQRPNIVLIMVDDMGFSDIGCYGGEIETPNLDALAAGGVKFSNFHNTGRCCPTRASLLTGLAPHQTGIGHMTIAPGRHMQRAIEQSANRPPAYQGFVNERCLTIAQQLQPAGYATFMTGKWHLGMHDKQYWPLQRGFEKYYGCPAGATHFFHPKAPRGMLLGNEPVTQYTSTTEHKYYTTDAYTDYAIQFINEEKQSQGRPFFLYLAYTAPHFPIQAHEHDIAKYRGKYKNGWLKLREERYQRQLDSGLMQPEWKLAPLHPKVPDWNKLTEKQKDTMDLRMATYAAMIDCVDQNIGKLVQTLKANGQFDNTLILFLSDNGSCFEGPRLGKGDIRNSASNPNDQNMWVTYGAWANLSNVPFRWFKLHSHEGGTATPFIMHWTKYIKPNKNWYRENAGIIDIVPTLLQVAQLDYPASHKSQPLPKLSGTTLTPSFRHQKLDRRKPLFNEHENHAFLIDGDWKLVGANVATPAGIQEKRWELYNLANDRTELNNLAKSHPEKRQQLARQWSEWANRVGVYPKQ